MASLTLILGACGGGGSRSGGPTSFTIGGSLSGLTSGNSVTLADNGTDSLSISGNGTFTFETAVASDASYAVTIATQPTGQVCSVSNGVGSSLTSNVTNVSIACSTDTYTIGGTLSGLTPGQQAIIFDNGGDGLTLKANGAFTFATPIAYNGNYSVTVSTQPTGQYCAVSGGAGSKVAAKVSNVAISCTTNQSVGGIWKSSYVVQSGPNAGTTDDSIALSTESGQVFVFDENTTTLCSALTFGSLSVEGNSVTGTGRNVLITYAPGTTINTTCLYPDSTTSASGTLTGTVTQRDSLTLTTQAVTSSGLSLPSATTNWTFDSAYLKGASLASIAGNYDDNGQLFTIASNGAISETDPNGCVITGTIAPINAIYNSYNIDLSFAGCTGYPASAFNGDTLSGIAALDMVGSSANLLFGVSGTVDGALVAIGKTLPLQPAYVHAWAATGSMTTARSGHAAIQLPNGTVLVAGGNTEIGSTAAAEIYNPSTGAWIATASMTTARRDPTATLLRNGTVLVTSGGTAEIYNPATGAWTPTSNMTTARSTYTATLLPNGSVLVAGGGGNGGLVLSSSEVYDPVTAAWTPTGSMIVARCCHTATQLQNGSVLVVGGAVNTGSPQLDVEIYNPATGRWLVTGNITSPPYEHTATLLANGTVLIAGGATSQTAAEIYNPSTGTWAPTGSMTTGRANHTATLLSNGVVLVAGGYSNSGLGGQPNAVASAEIFNPNTGSWTPTGNMTRPRSSHKATLLTNGRLLATGGASGQLSSPTDSAEIY